MPPAVAFAGADSLATLHTLNSARRKMPFFLDASTSAFVASGCALGGGDADALALLPGVCCAVTAVPTGAAASLLTRLDVEIAHTHALRSRHETNEANWALHHHCDELLRAQTAERARLLATLQRTAAAPTYSTTGGGATSPQLQLLGTEVRELRATIRSMVVDAAYGGAAPAPARTASRRPARPAARQTGQAPAPAATAAASVALDKGVVALRTRFAGLIDRVASACPERINSVIERARAIVPEAVSAMGADGECEINMDLLTSAQKLADLILSVHSVLGAYALEAEMGDGSGS